jgi:hypothetical protein
MVFRWVYPVFLASFVVSPALAGDYSHECTSSDQRYTFSDAVPFRASDKDQKAPLTYAILETQNLEVEAGYCVPSNAGQTDVRFNFDYRKYRMRLLIDERSGPQSVRVVCELAASGLPASLNCNERVTTEKSTKPTPVISYATGTPGNWEHNGSVMRLEAQGNERRFFYMNPRDGIRKVGVSGDQLLFEGTRDGSRYVGIARVFKKTCGVQEFPVSGEIADGELRVVLAGNAPIVDDQCNVTGSKPEQLVFERNP